MPQHGPPTPPPEAALIRRARKAHGLSTQQAAGLTAIRLGASRWGQIERGYKSPSEPARAPAETLAHMADVVGVTPERLDEVDRGDAAEILREILHQRPAPTPPYADLTDTHERALWEMNLPEEIRRDLIDALRASRRQRKHTRSESA